MSFRDYAVLFLIASAVGLMFGAIVGCQLSMWIGAGSLALFSCLAR